MRHSQRSTETVTVRRLIPFKSRASNTKTSVSTALVVATDGPNECAPESEYVLLVHPSVQHMLGSIISVGRQLRFERSLAVANAPMASSRVVAASASMSCLGKRSSIGSDFASSSHKRVSLRAPVHIMGPFSSPILKHDSDYDKKIISLFLDGSNTAIKAAAASGNASTSPMMSDHSLLQTKEQSPLSTCSPVL